MFQEFPYTDMHQLNLDWIIKIAKDFLDQYTHIQQLISDGETALDEKTQEEITQLQTELAVLVEAFRTSAHTIGDDVIESIPVDYTALSTNVDVINELFAHLLENVSDYIPLGTMESGYYVKYQDGGLGVNADYSATDYLPIEAGATYTINCDGNVQFAWYSSESTDGYINGIVKNTAPNITVVTMPENAAYLRMSCLTDSIDTLNIIKTNYDALRFRKKVLENTLQTGRTLVVSSNYNSLLPDLNDVKESCVYRLNFAVGSTSVPAHTPYGNLWMSNHVVTFVNLSNYDDANYRVGHVQYFITSDGVFVRQRSSDWEDWECLHYDLWVNKAGHANPFTDLTPAILWANNFYNVTVHVGVKDYYLIGEFQAVYGNSFFDNFNVNSVKGLHLTKGIHVIFDQGARVLFGYDGNNEYVHTLFSPFNFSQADVDGFTLENAWIYARNCRYIVHDDPSDMARAYTNKYINCRMELNNTNNPDWPQTRCIGAGLGRNATIVIEGGQYNGVNFDGRVIDDVIMYHNDVNNNATTARSHITIKDVYVRGGTIGFCYGGPSELQTDVEVTNCSMVGNIMKYAITGDYAQTDNMTIRAWNNDIRS